MKVPKDEPLAKQPPQQDAKAVRLRQLDSEAMEAFRNGQQREGFTKLLDAAKAYQKVTPADCTVEESLALAVVYARIASLAGKALPEDTASIYVAATQEYSKKGGIASVDYLPWFQKLLTETAAAYKSPDPPAGKAPTWVASARKELDAAKRRPKLTEPVKPARMTPAEFDLMKESAVDIFKSLHPIDNPAKFPTGEEAVLLLDIRLDAVALMPHSHAAVRREAYTRLAAHVKNDKDALTNMANAFPEARRLHTDAKFLAVMQARLPWAERKKLYDQFTKATGQKEKWSLLVPFDDLTGAEMKSAVAAAEGAKVKGWGP